MSLEFLRQNAPLLSAFASVGGFFIWTIYAILFYSELRYRRSPHIFIHAAGDGGSSTECLIINLSSEPVHVLCSLASRDDVAVQIQASSDQELPLKVRAKQGPLDTGESLSLGRFESIARELEDIADVVREREKREKREKREECDDDEQQIDVRVAAIYGKSDLPIGATRRFIYNKGSSRIIPSMPHTEQKRSRRGSRLVSQWMEQCHSYRG